MFERINNIVMLVIIAIGVILMVMTMSSGLTPEQSECTDCGAVGSFIGLSYILLLVAVLATLGGAVLQALMNPGQIKGTLIGVGVVAVVLILSYVLADGTVETYFASGTTETSSKLSGAGLYAFYILFVLAVVSIAYSSISKLLK
ncbi:MAG: hypothetical protein WEC59_03680 [Salibacteraceae bacterium]